MLCQNYGIFQPLHKTSNMPMKLIKLTSQNSELCKLWSLGPFAEQCKILLSVTLNEGKKNFFI